MRVLLLAGTVEAREIAACLRDVPGVQVIASVAAITRTVQPSGVPMRVGGFGGVDGFAEYLCHENITAVMDATHPFSADISHRSFAVCQRLNIPYLQVLRPPWVAGPGDRWADLNREEDAAHHIPVGARVFVATGRKTLHRFENMSGRLMICRQIETADGAFPLDHGYYLLGHPPFSVADEVDLFRELNIDWLIMRNAGGDASRPKLDAARQLHLPVAMIRRSAQPDAPQVETVAAAVDWVKGQI
nr:cobalt-precorrin-6A reductase [Oceaniglobus ichthyenteri]